MPGKHHKKRVVTVRMDHSALERDLAAAQVSWPGYDPSKPSPFDKEQPAEAAALRVDAELSDDAIECAVRAWFEDTEHGSIPVGATFIRRMRAAIAARKDGV